MSGVTKKLMSAFSGVAGPVEAQAVDFDGTSDFLSRSTDLVGNADGRAFTFSAWVYGSDLAASNRVFYTSGSTVRFQIFTDGGGNLTIDGRSSAGSTVYARSVNVSENLAADTFNHVLVSVNVVSSQQSLYINDVLVSGSATISNSNIDFTNAQHTIAVNQNLNNGFFKGRLSNVFLDYTYRDLSVEANRRLFITDEGTPASGQASLNPILYLPMDDPAEPGRNDGTGGNFTLNGIVARSGRGPNQYNAAASTFNGTNQYLENTNLTYSNGKQLTVSFNINRKGNIWVAGDTGSDASALWRVYIQDTEITFQNFTQGGTGYIFQVRASHTMALNSYHSIQFSVDVSDSTKSVIIIDGEVKTLTTNTTQDISIQFSTSRRFMVGGIDGNSLPYPVINGLISDFYFHPTYIDLSASNPFYDTETDKPKFLGEFGELPTGSAPLIYLPLRADDAGNNKGTGGDFTVNSGPYIGARGPSEFWGGSANDINSPANHLSNPSLVGGGSSISQLTVAVAYNVSNITGTLIQINGNTSSSTIFIKPIHNSGYRFSMKAADGFDVIEATSNTAGTINTWNTLLMSFDVTSTAKRHVYLNGVAADIVYDKYFTSRRLEIGSGTTTTLLGNGSGTPLFGRMGFLWFNTEYIDFSQEANRLKFFDAFGYPVELGEDGSLPTGNVPLIYMNEDFHLGTNYGSGGNFTPVNAPTDGGYVKG